MKLKNIIRHSSFILKSLFGGIGGIRLLLIFILIPVFLSCEKKLGEAEVDIIDPRRHYYPVIQGELMGVTYEIENTSKNPLFIREIQTTCGCLIPNDELPIVILPNQTGKVSLSYNTTKNVGFVEHFIWLYGNFRDSVWRELQFDTNVVPPRDYTRDYEMIFRDVQTGAFEMKDLINGKSSEKGYYLEDWSDPRDENREDIQNEVDRLIGF